MKKFINFFSSNEFLKIIISTIYLPTPVYIYIEREREKERCIYIYIYIESSYYSILDIHFISSFEKMNFQNLINIY